MIVGSVLICGAGPNGSGVPAVPDGCVGTSLQPPTPSWAPLGDAIFDNDERDSTVFSPFFLLFVVVPRLELIKSETCHTLDV